MPTYFPFITPSFVYKIKKERKYKTRVNKKINRKDREYKNF